MPSENSTQPIVLRTPGDLLAHLPYQIGYHPGPDDVVFFGLRGSQPQGTAVLDSTSITLGSNTDTDIKLGSAVGIDPSAGQNLVGLDRLWRDVMARIMDPVIGLARARTRAGCDIDLQSVGEPRVIVVSYGAPQADALVRAFVALRPDGEAPELVDAFRVSEGRWWSLTCPGTGCCPLEGRPLNPATESVASAVVEGCSPRATQAEVAAVLEPGPAQLVQATAAHLPPRPWAVSSDPPAGSSKEGFAALQAARDARLSNPQVSSSQRSDFTPGSVRQGTSAAVAAARLLIALEDVRVRDQCLGWTDEAAGRLWRDLIRFAPPGWSAPVATVIGIHAICNHDHPLARIAFRHALHERPGYHLAHLAQRLLEIGLDTDDFTALLVEAATLAATNDADPEMNTPGESTPRLRTT